MDTAHWEARETGERVVGEGTVGRESPEDACCDEQLLAPSTPGTHACRVAERERSRDIDRRKHRVFTSGSEWKYLRKGPQCSSNRPTRGDNEEVQQILPVLIYRPVMREKAEGITQIPELATRD